APSVSPRCSIPSPRPRFSTTPIHRCLPALYSKLSPPRCLTLVGTEGAAFTIASVQPSHARKRRSYLARSCDATRTWNWRTKLSNGVRRGSSEDLSPFRCPYETVHGRLTAQPAVGADRRATSSPRPGIGGRRPLSRQSSGSRDGSPRG